MMISRIGNRFRLSVIGYRLSPANTENRTPNTEQAFTLIELMISVAILGFGLVIVIQSYITSASALNISQNYVEAMRLARDKLTELELVSYENNGLLPYAEFGSGTEKIRSRDFNWVNEVREISDPDYLTDKLVEVCVKLNWKEAGKTKDALLSTYLAHAPEETPK